MKLRINGIHKKTILVAVSAIILILIFSSCNGTNKAYDRETVEFVNVPNVTGMLAKDAQIILEESGLHLGDVTIVAKSSYDDVGNCTVVEQKPEADSQVKKGDSIDLVVDYVEQKSEKQSE